MEGLVRFGFVALLLLAAAAQAEPGSIEGVGRIQVSAGYRWTPNWYFTGKAAEAGTPVVRASIGGPQATASFGYGATSWLEGTIDVLGAIESFELSGYLPFTSSTYGALLGIRVARLDVWVPGLVPHAGVQVGPMLSTVSSATLPGTEHLQLGYSVNGGLTWRFSERFGLTLDVRWLYARIYVDGISGINVGGVWFSLGLTTFFAPAPKRDLDVPGF